MTNTNQMLVFNRRAVRQHRDRAAPHFQDHSVLFEESANHILERLSDIKRDFKAILDLGAHRGFSKDAFNKYQGSFIVASDISEKMLFGNPYASVIADEEVLPFASNSFDLILSNLSLHWVNDLPGTFLQIKDALRPDGLFMATLLGGETLSELRLSLIDAELKVTGGASPRLSPTLELRTAAALLQRAGFILPVVDQERLTLTYGDAFALMRDIRGMGETNAHLEKIPHATRRAIFEEAALIYQSRFPAPSGEVHATFDILFLHGWKALP